MAVEFISFSLLSLSSLLIIVNPLGAALVYVALTEGMPTDIKRRMARESCRLAGIILVIFALLGTSILQLFGITLESFRIAGGILLFVIALEMVYAKTSRTKLTTTEKYESIEADDIAIMPLAIPIIAGPGSITTVVVLSNEAIGHDFALLGIVIISILLTIIVTYVLLQNSERILKKIGQREYRVLNRLMGILLMAIAVQFVINGLQTAFPILMGA